MEFQKGSGTLEGALVLETALGLDFAELVERLSELAGEPLRVHAEGGEGAVEAPRGVGELLGELDLLRTSRKTECDAGKLLAHLTVRAAPFALGGSGGLHWRGSAGD